MEGEHAVRAPVSRGFMNSNEVRPPTDASYDVICTFACRITFAFSIKLRFLDLS